MGADMIRPASPADAEAIARVLVDAWQTAYAGLIDPSYSNSMSVEKYSSIFKGIILSEVEAVFVYESGAGIVGFSSGITGSGEYASELKGLYVAPEHQGKGIGQALLGHMKEFFRSAGCTGFVAWTLLGARNNRFYLANGGVGLKKKMIRIGGAEYPGIGFCFDPGMRECGYC